MEQQPLVSFIIPTYNLPEPLLRECIESIMALSLREYEREIIVVDDGSKRAAIACLGDIADTIIYIRQKNSGLSAARNRGIQNASGLYLQFVDGDDLLISNLYEHCLDLARFQKPDMVMFDFVAK
jgi:glycosyltransferase involved in cell wall biosynthesis